MVILYELYLILKLDCGHSPYALDNSALIFGEIKNRVWL